mmetsp:Transcript_30275/g.98458  ORF Transcript_30275/g.98458 Transcript_30275/m.98458 type:complete len:321 (-) Transcript_30275:395-1357(-)
MRRLPQHDSSPLLLAAVVLDFQLAELLVLRPVLPLALGRAVEGRLAFGALLGFGDDVAAAVAAALRELALRLARAEVQAAEPLRGFSVAQVLSRRFGVIAVHAVQALPLVPGAARLRRLRRLALRALVVRLLRLLVREHCREDAQALGRSAQVEVWVRGRLAQMVDGAVERFDDVARECGPALASGEHRAEQVHRHLRHPRVLRERKVAPSHLGVTERSDVVLEVGAAQTANQVGDERRVRSDRRARRLRRRTRQQERAERIIHCKVRGRHLALAAHHPLPPNALRLCHHAACHFAQPRFHRHLRFVRARVLAQLDGDFP